MPKKLLLFTLLLMLPGFAGAQTASPTRPADAAKLEKAAVEFLRETSAEVGRLRTAENRISFDSELASLMWFHDEKEATAMYGSVVGDFKQLLTQLDMQMNSPQVTDDDDLTALGGIFGSYGKTKIERKLRIAMEVRKQIAMSLAEHAPDLAYNFFYDSINLISSPQFRKETEQSDKYFESQLIRQIGEADAAKAALFGHQSIKRGVDSDHIVLLKKIYEKDADKGIEFGAAILRRLKTDKIKNPSFYDNLLSFGAENYEASKKAGGRKPVYDQSDLHDIAEQFAQAILDGKLTLYYDVTGFISKIEKYAPGRGAQIRAKTKNNEAESVVKAANMMAPAGPSGLSTGSDANKASADELARLARDEREKAEKKMKDDVKALGTKPLPKEQRDQVAAQARNIISQTPGKDKKIVALSFLAAHVSHSGDKDLAGEIMLDADRLVDPQPKNYQDFLLSWLLASGYAESNPDKAFPLLESTILRANDTIAAFVKVGEFIDVSGEMIEDGEVQVGMFGGSMIREVTNGLGMASGTLRSLAVADFAKTRDLTNTFDRTETRVLAKMMVLRAVLDKKTDAAPKDGDRENVLTKGDGDMPK